MWMKETAYTVNIGTNVFHNCPTLVRFRGESIFGLYRADDGTLAIDFPIYDSSGQKLAQVKRNNIYPTELAKDEYFFSGTADMVALINKRTRNVLAEIRKRAAAETELDVFVSTFLSTGLPFIATPSGLQVGTRVIRNCRTSDCGTGIALS